MKNHGICSAYKHGALHRVVACPVGALELFTDDPATTEKIYRVKDGKALVLDFRAELCAGCGVCVEACPYDVIRLDSSPPPAEAGAQ